MAPVNRHDVVLFGEMGAGKSSVVNMLCGQDKAAVSSSASGCTLSSTGYEGAMADQPFTFWDTAGLNEGDIGKVPNMKAVVGLYRLLRQLEGA
jgi:tRNA U34 5-carboxymethylaminomethyl modifying GTPase MnmE/TrmE